MIDFTNEEISEDSVLNTCVSNEMQNLSLQLEFQKEKKQTLIIWANNLTEGIDTFEKNTNTSDLLSIIESLKENMKNVNSNIDIVSELIALLNNIVSDIENMSYKNNVEAFFDKLNFYNVTSSEKSKILLENNVKIEKFVQNLYKYSEFNNPVNSTTSPDVQKESPSIIQETPDTTFDINKYVSPETATIEENIPQDNNVLIISETKGQVFLPYKLSDLEKELQSKKNTYKDIYSLINEKYIIPLDRYKNSSIARFRESYSLMRTKEKASFIKALELALELTFKYNLHPAIISACKTLDELDIYLDCLEENELNKFTIFEIKYEVLPMKRRK